MIMSMDQSRTSLWFNMHGIVKQCKCWEDVQCAWLTLHPLRVYLMMLCEKLFVIRVLVLQICLYPCRFVVVVVVVVVAAQRLHPHLV